MKEIVSSISSRLIGCSLNATSHSKWHPNRSSVTPCKQPGASALCKSRSGAQLRPRRGLRFGAGNSLRRRGRRGPDLLWQHLVLHQKFDFGSVEHFALEQRMGNALEGLAAAQQYVARPFIRRGDDLFHFLVDADGSVFDQEVKKIVTAAYERARNILLGSRE